MIKYKGGYKYQLAKNYRVKVGIIGNTIKQGPIKLTRGGWLTIRKGYAWDGPSGPAIDTKNFMRGSLVHDALYQLMRLGRLDADTDRDPADRILQQMCIQDGMWRFRAWWIYLALRFFGAPAAKNKKKIISAP